MKKIAIALLAGCIAPAFAWLAGFDFDHRGWETFATGMFALYFTVAAYGWMSI